MSFRRNENENNGSITPALLHREIPALLANLRKHIRSNPVLELHGSRKFGAKHQGIESALVDEAQLIPVLCCCSILLDTSHYPCTAFRRTWVINMSLNGITLILDWLEITMAQPGIKLLQEHHPHYRLPTTIPGRMLFLYTSNNLCPLVLRGHK